MHAGGATVPYRETFLAITHLNQVVEMAELGGVKFSIVFNEKWWPKVGLPNGRVDVKGLILTQS